MVRRLGLSGKLTREEVSAYERGVREPSLPTLSRYAEIAQVWIDVLVDDDLDLPKELPSPTKSEGIGVPYGSLTPTCRGRRRERGAA
jgi:transcriptional regulator with XRE-family HTH domain